METNNKPYVHLTRNAVDVVVLDPAGSYDPEQYDRYATFDQARDAALTSIELMLDAGDYEDAAHRAELETALRLLEPARDYAELERSTEYRGLLAQLAGGQTLAA